MAHRAEGLTAGDIIAAIKAKYRGCAILTEVVITDPDWLDKWTVGQDCYGTQRRIDALMWRSLQRTAIEVKISRADFRRDTDAKRSIWQQHAHRFVYATPAGLVDPSEVPTGCGLWEVSESRRVTVTKRARINREPSDLPAHVVQAIAYRAMKQEANDGSPR